jgi:hypothetical protein
MKKDDGFKDKYSFIDDVGGVMPYVLVSLFYFFGALLGLKGEISSFYSQASMLGLPKFNINLFVVLNIFTLISFRLIDNTFIQKFILILFSVFYLVLVIFIFREIKYGNSGNFIFENHCSERAIFLSENISLIMPFIIAMLGFIKIKKIT